MIPTSSLQVKQEYLDQYSVFEVQNNNQVKPYAPQALTEEDLAVKEKRQSRNRYPDVLPYQANIFRFQEPSRYFNASCVLQGRAICCQGPLECEYDHFWRMVWESNTKAIFMLTDLVEKNKTKCFWYLPLEEGETLPANDELPIEEVIMVTQVKGLPKPTNQSPQGFIGLDERTLELEYKGEKRIVIHDHIRGWGDGQVAPEIFLAKVVLLVWEKYFSKGEHIIFHCSAGIGRSGAFLATLETFSQFKKMPVLTKDLVMNVVKQLRSFEHGRDGMVQTKEQYGLIFKTLAVLDPNCAEFFCTQTSL